MEKYSIKLTNNENNALPSPKKRWPPKKWPPKQKCEGLELVEPPVYFNQSPFLQVLVSNIENEVLSKRKYF